MKFINLTLAALLTFTNSAQAWSGYCYDCSTKLPLSDFTYSCCAWKIGTDEVYHCWDFPASKKDTFSGCCKKYGKCAVLY